MAYIPFDDLQEKHKEIVQKEFEKNNRFDYGLYSHLLSETGIFIDFKPIKEVSVTPIHGTKEKAVRTSKKAVKTHSSTSKQPKNTETNKIKRKRGRPRKS